LRCSLTCAALLVSLWTSPGWSAELPTHDPLRILVVVDTDNLHGLPGEDLTEPGEFAAALGDPASDLNLAQPVTPVDSQCVDEALTQLTSSTPPDVVIYFAAHAARGCDGSDQQQALTDALEAHLERGGGVIGFHHGMYAAEGKRTLLELLGGEYAGATWDASEGQDVVCLAGAHFVTANNMSYPETVSFELPGLGIAAGTYEQFVNVPDERYTTFTPFTVEGESRRYLFGSTSGGANTVLSYELQRPGWRGWVVTYQPGEHQPTALDVDGNNFQILVNAIWWTQRAPQVTDPNPVEPTAEPTTPAAPQDGCSGSPAPPATMLLLVLGVSLLRRRRSGRVV